MFRPRSGIWSAFAVLAWCGFTATTGSAADFAYFLDNLSQIDNTPAGYAVIGEASPEQRNTWTSQGRVVGMSVALKQNANPGFNLWPLISNHFTSSTPVTDKQTLAQNILNDVMLYPGEFPTAGEGTPASPGDGYVVWAQDFEFNPSTAASANEVYAGVTAVLWAGRQVLGENFKIIPVPSSSLFKTLGKGSEQFDSQLILQGTESTPYLASLELSPIGANNPQSGSGGEWNFLSTLHHNGLIDGFLGQQYSKNNPDALPGSISADTRHFYEDMPYAILSSQGQLTDTTIDGPPWDSHYEGDLPFKAGVYWPDVVDSGFDPSSYLTPTEDALTNLSFVPEPATMALLLAGLAIGCGRRRCIMRC